MIFLLQDKLVFAALVALVLPAIGYLYELIGERRDARLRPPPGQLVKVGGRRLHLVCKGTKPPTVVIETGAGELSCFWWPVQDRIAEFARVCTYDRAGFGWSDAAPNGRTIEDRAEELRSLLANADIHSPYIFVAHSYGGLIARSYAANHPNEVAGLVLVDTPEESSIFQRNVLDFYAKVRAMNRVAGLAARLGLLRLLRHWIALERYGFWLGRAAEYSALCDDLASLELVPEAQRISKAEGCLGAMPMVVITHGQAFPGPFAVLETNWSEAQRRLAALSKESMLVVASKSNHMIHQDEPELVLDAVLRVHGATSF